MTVDAGKRVEADVEVTDSGVNVPLSELGELGIPGQRVHITMTQPRRRPRRSTYGILAGKVPPITREEIKVATREAWGEWASD